MDKKIAAMVTKSPHETGVYIWKGDNDKVLYVGKARDLRSRLASYQNPPDTEAAEKVLRLMEQVSGLDYMVTATEWDALVLEANIIKQHKPPFNVRLTDDKFFPYVRVTRGRYPSVSVVRKVRKDDARYLGPYGDAKAIRRTLRFARTLFPVRDCKWREGRQRERPCLEYHLGRCLAPCAFEVDDGEYSRCLKGVLELLSGRGTGVRRELRRRMQELSERMDYERAAKVRDNLYDLEKSWTRQDVDVGRDEDLDAVGFYHDGEDYLFYLLVVREGKLLRGEPFRLQGRLGQAEALSSFMTRCYRDSSYVPPLILVSMTTPEVDALAEILSQRNGRKVVIKEAKRGRRARLVEMADRNARLIFYQPSGSHNGVALEAERGMRELRAHIGLKKVPRLIEGFDVSNLGGRDVTAAVVIFKNGKPEKGEYRRLRIKAGGGGDVEAMREALLRRYSSHPLPDIILLDGGIPQLAAARDVSAKLGVELPVIALAKEHEEIYIPMRPSPLRLHPDSPALRLLQRVRDESHRFASNYHRLLRRKRLSASILDEVPGVGEVRKRALLRAFPNTTGLRSASIDEIAAVPGINRKVAENVHSYMRGGS